jgi:hypothetical protein
MHAMEHIATENTRGFQNSTPLPGPNDRIEIGANAPTAVAGDNPASKSN